MEDLQSFSNMPCSSPKVSLLSPTVAGGCESCNGVVQEAKDIKMKLEEQLVLNLCKSKLRGNALAELSKEILAVYPTYIFSTIPASASSRACNALALLQTIASHSETRIPFVRADVPLYFYEFLDSTNNCKAFESLSLTSLGILGSLVKADDVEVEVIPLCLNIMEIGNVISKVVATFIIQKILLHDAGLKFSCSTVDRFFNITNVLSNLVEAHVNEPYAKLLKLAIRCYLALTYHSKALAALRNHFPEALKDRTFNDTLKEDPEAVQWLQQLLDRLKEEGVEGTSLPSSSNPVEGESVWGEAPPLVPVDASSGTN